jgi:hypothetical protein
MINFTELYNSLRNRLQISRLNGPKSRNLYHKIHIQQMKSEKTGTIRIADVKNYVRQNIQYEIGSFLDQKFISQHTISLQDNPDIDEVWNNPLASLSKER